MLDGAIATYKRRAMLALLVRDAASALYRVASPAIAPLLMSVALAAPSDVDRLVVVHPVAVGNEAGESQASMVPAGHHRSEARASSYGTLPGFAALPVVDGCGAARVARVEPRLLAEARKDSCRPSG